MTSTELNLPWQPQAFTNSSRVKHMRLAIVFSREISRLSSGICTRKSCVQRRICQPNTSTLWKQNQQSSVRRKIVTLTSRGHLWRVPWWKYVNDDQQPFDCENSVKHLTKIGKFRISCFSVSSVKNENVCSQIHKY